MTIQLFGFPIFDLIFWVYLMMVIPETMHAH